MPVYLVTGSAGFIGARVCRSLLEKGYIVVGIDNLNEAYDVRLKKWRLNEFKGFPGFKFHCVDIAKDLFSLDKLFSLYAKGKNCPFEGVINLAARAGVRQSVEEPTLYYETNLTGTLNLLELCRKFGVRKFVQASTSSLYGKDNQMPYREDANTDHCLSPYAASKKAAETLCYTYHYLYGIDITIFRYFTVYGPAGRPDMSPFRFVQWIYEGKRVTVYGDGSQSRDYTHVDDIACGTVKGLKPLGYEIINLGSDKPITLMDFIHLIEKRIGKKARIEFKPRHPSDVLATWADIEKAEKLLGWKPRIDLEQGIAGLVKWYEENRSWAKHIQTL